MMLLKFCTQHDSKFGKQSSGHRTGKGVFITIPEKGSAKECSNSGQQHSFHMLIKLWSKSFKLGFNSMWTKNFQMFKLVLEKAEEPEIKLPTFCWIMEKAREFQKNIYFCFIDYAKAFDYVDHNKLWKILEGISVPDYLTSLLIKLVYMSRSNS